MTNAAQGFALDIDDTLADTAQTCFEQIHSEFGCAEAFDTDALLEKYGQPWFVPSWQTDEINNWIQKHLNDEDFLFNVPPIPSIDQKMTELTAVLPISVYITSRPSTVSAVTQKWLDHHGFPPAPLVTRDLSITQWDWKIGYLVQHYPDTFALVDNEIHVLSVNSYKGHLLEIHRNRKVTPQHEQVQEFSNWEQLLEFVKAVRA